jgi:polyisoprenoid-binding protein YceI
MSAAETTTETTTRTELPSAGTWAIEPSHSSVEAVARHLMVSKVRGRFTAFEGTVVVADDITESAVDVRIGASSIDTGDEQRDGHLVSADFLDAESHPHLTFTSERVVPKGGDRYEIPGQLTIRGTTRPVTLDVSFLGLLQDPWGNTRAALTASTTLDREAFGMTWNQALETGGVLVGKKLEVEIDVQLVQAQDDDQA